MSKLKLQPLYCISALFQQFQLCFQENTSSGGRSQKLTQKHKHFPVISLLFHHPE